MLLFIIFLVFTDVSHCNAEEELKLNDSSVYRLPKNVIPSMYSLWLYIDAVNAEFRGNVTIAITVLEPTNKITLNVNNISIDTSSVVLDKLNGNTSTIQIFNVREPHQMIDLIFTETLLTNGNYELSLKFEGSFQRHQTIGFFQRDYYIDAIPR